MEIVTTSSVSPADAFRAPTASSCPPSWSGGAPLPTRLRRVLEQLSGYALSDIRVYADSPWPARLGARAFAFGSDLHLSPGAEDALEHEAWHVVQQKQGRVRATSCLQAPRLGVVDLNDDEALEREADTMGLVARCLARRDAALPREGTLRIAALQQPVVQRQVTVSGVEIGDAASLEEKIKNELFLVQGDVVDFDAIVRDLLHERLVFENWPAVKREILIREVGYQAETQMRALAVEHGQRFRAATARLNVREALAKARNEALAPLTSKEAELVVNRAYDLAGIIRWADASFFKYKKKDYQLFQWLAGRRVEDPLRMNCWEAVVYALVKTGLVHKSYITWCIRQAPADSHVGMEGLNSPNNLAVSIVRNMDYFFWAPAFAVGMERRDKQMLPNVRGKSASIQIPSDMVIPRGRILMFATNMHVALSTGRVVGNKHEVLELDSQTATVQLGYIEDYSAHYRSSMVVAPFPACPAGRVTVSEEDGDRTSKRLELKKKNAKEATRQKSKIEALSQKNIRKLEQQKDQPGTLELIEKERSDCRRECEQIDEQARVKTEEELRQWLQTRPDPGLEVITLSYQASDPYAGALELP